MGNYSGCLKVGEKNGIYMTIDHVGIYIQDFIFKTYSRVGIYIQDFQDLYSRFSDIQDFSKHQKMRNSFVRSSRKHIYVAT